MRTLRLNNVVVALAVLSVVMFLYNTCCAGCSSADSLTTSRPSNLAQANQNLFVAPRSYLSAFEMPLASAIACMKRLPDGAHVCVNRKCVTAVWFDHMFIQEADRSAGIKVVFVDHFPTDVLDRGHLVSFTGVMGTVGGQRVIYETSEFTYDFSTREPLESLGMSDAAIQGWPMNPRQPDGPRWTGLSPIGLFVKVWGVVTSTNWADEDGYYIYLDDGWGKKDGSEADATGIRVYSNVIPNLGDFLVAPGILSTKVAYDPTPDGPSGDELIIPVIRATNDLGPYIPTYEPVTYEFGSASGTVRLIGEAAPGKTVRIYSQYESIVLDNVTNEPRPFTLRRVPIRNGSNGIYVTASAPGYISDTSCIGSGNTNVAFELQSSPTHVEVQADKQSIAICDDDSTSIVGLVRDCEGKGLSGRQLKFTTTRGVFADYQSKEVVLTTNGSGVASVRLAAGSDGVGVASIKAQTYPDGECWNTVSVVFRGPQITISANPTYLVQSGTSVIAASVTTDGTPIPGANIVFRTDYGVFQESGTATCEVEADETGTARATLAISAPGTARVTAIYTNECGQQAVNWTVVSYKSWPWYSQGVQYSNPLIADLYGNPDKRKQVVLVTTAGSLMVLDANGAVLWSKIMHLPGNNTPSCAPMDGERSGRPCVFIPAESQQRVYAFAYDGRTLAGWPVGSNYRFIRVAATIADLNLDGSPEIVAGDECCYVFAWNATGDWRKTGTSESSFLWRNLTGSASTTIYGTTTAVGDIDLDANGILDVILGSNHTTAVFAFPGDAWGDFISNPLYLPGYPKSAGARVQTSPAIGDIDGDGKNDVAVGSDDGSLYIGLSSDGSWRGYPTGGMIKSSPALYDLDGDGRLDVIVGSDSGKLCAFNWLGQAPDGWGQGIKLSSSAEFAIESSPVVGDVTGDGVPEVVVGCNDGNIYAVYADAINHRENGVLTGPIAWVRCCVPPNKTSAHVYTSPVIDDLDGDGKVEVLAAGDEGVYVFHFDAPYNASNPSLYPWPTFHRDNERTGCATPSPPLVNASIQGIVTKNGSPVINAKIYIMYQDGTPVYEPHSNPPVARSWVQTVGTTDPNEAGKGAYCISQLPPNSIYKLKVEVPNEPIFWVENIAVTTGLKRVDIALPN